MKEIQQMGVIRCFSKGVRHSFEVCNALPTAVSRSQTQMFDVHLRQHVSITAGEGLETADTKWAWENDTNGQKPFGKSQNIEIIRESSTIVLMNSSCAQLSADFPRIV